MSKVRRSLVLSFLEKYTTLVLTVATIAVLARILTPAQTGIYSVAAGLINTAQTLRDFGVGNYIVQEPELSKDRLRTTLGISVLLGTILAFCFASASSAIASFYREPQVQPVIAILSANFVIVGFSSLGWAQLHRNMDFAALAQINIVAQLCRSATSVTLAYLGFGAEAMAWSSVVGTSITLAGAYLALGRAGLIIPGLAGWRPIMRFGVASMGVSVLQMIAANAPDVIVGRVLGVAPAGLLSRARSLITLLETSFMSAVRPVIVTSLAAANRSGQPTQDRFIRSVDYILLIAWPLLAMMAILAKPIIIVAFGGQWIPATAASRIMCVAGAFWLLGDLASMTLVAMGAIRRNLMTFGIATPIQLLLIVFGCRFGIEGVAVSLTLSAALQGLLAQLQCNQLLEVMMMRLAPVLGRTIGAVLATSIVPLALVLTRTDVDLRTSLTTLALGGTGGLLSWLGYIFAIHHPLRDEIVSIAQSVLNRVMVAQHR